MVLWLIDRRLKSLIKFLFYNWILEMIDLIVLIKRVISWVLKFASLSWSRSWICWKAPFSLWVNNRHKIFIYNLFKCKYFASWVFWGIWIDISLLHNQILKFWLRFSSILIHCNHILLIRVLHTFVRDSIIRWTKYWKPSWILNWHPSRRHCGSWQSSFMILCETFTSEPVHFISSSEMLKTPIYLRIRSTNFPLHVWMERTPK